MIRLQYFFLGMFILVPSTLASTFKTRCDKAVTSSLNIPEIQAHYLRGSCFVLDSRKKKFDEIQCNYFLVDGYLALLPGITRVNKIYDLFRSFIPPAAYIGFLRNGSSLATSNRDVWYWHIDDEQQWYAPKETVKWYPGEPNEPGAITCGVLFISGTLDSIGNHYCTDLFNFLCEYRDKQGLGFKSVKRGAQGSANMTVSEHTNVNFGQCSLLCTKSPICQSYSYSKQQQLCALHFLPAEELTTEAIIDGQIFDIID